MPKLYTSNYPSSGYASEALMRSELQKIEDAFEDVVPRIQNIDSPQLQADIDMNNYDLLNVKNIDVQGLTLDGGTLQDEIEAGVQSVISEVEDRVTAAQIAAGAAQLARDVAEGHADDAELYSIAALAAAATSSMNNVGLAPVQSLQVLKSLTGLADKQVVVLDDNVEHRTGKFRYEAGNFSSSLSGVDPQEGVYVRLDDDPTSANGVLVRITDGFYSPEMFGALGDDEQVDDSVPFQAMLDFIYSQEQNSIGVVHLTPGRVYYCGDGADIVIDPGFTIIYGNGAQIAFTKTCSDNASQPELLTNAGFDSDLSGWTGFSTIDPSWNDLTYDSGSAAYTVSDGTYAGIYQQVTLTNNTWYSIKTLINSMSSGSQSHQYAAVFVRTDGPDAGAGYGKFYYPGDVGTEQEHKFKWTGATGTYWIQLKTNNPINVEYVSLKEVANNTCIELAGDYSPEAQQFSPILGAASFNNLTIKGVNSAALYGIGVLCNTDTVTYRTQYSFRDCTIKNFDVPLDMYNRTYICNWDGGVCIGGKTTCIRFGEGDDAGENMTLNKVTIGGTPTGAPAITNHGRYVHLNQCSIDYTGGAFLLNDGGYVHMTQCHMEKTHPAETDNYVLDIQSGTVIINQGYMQLNQVDPIVLTHCFNIGAGGRLVINDMQGFGLTSSTNEMWTGDGHADIRLSGIGQKTCAAFGNKAHTLVPTTPGTIGDGEHWPITVSGGNRVSYKETDNIQVGLEVDGLDPVLEATKLQGTGSPALLEILVPVPRRGIFSSEFDIRVSDVLNNAVQGALYNVYLDWHQVKAHMRPDGTWAINDPWWMGEYLDTRNLDLYGVSTTPWTTVLQSSGVNNTNAALIGQEFGFDGRTHCRLTINMTELPTGATVQVKNLIATVL